MMRCTPDFGGLHKGSALMRSVGIGCLCLAVFAGFAYPEQGLTASEPTVKPVAKPLPNAKSGTESPPRIEPKAVDRTKRKAAAIRRVQTARGRGPVRFEMNPDAKWVCDQPVVTREPVWRGDKDLTFTFHIRNAGTADLHIKARGG